MTRQTLLRRIRALVSRQSVERELSDEVRFHLQMEADDLIRERGVTRDEAERMARLRFGGVDRHVEAHRDVRGVRLLEDSIADLRYAVRALRRTPAFTVSTMLVLALGIGASTAIFSAVNAVLVSRLPYPDDERLVRIYNQNSPTNRFGLSVADMRGIATLQQTMSDIGAMSIRQSPVSAGDGEAGLMRTTPSSAGMFAALRIRAAVGRVVEKADEDPAAPPVVVLSDAYARRVFGSPAGAINKTLHIDGSPRAVVGVLPPGAMTVAGFRTDVIPAYQPRQPTRRGPFGLVVVGRLKDNVSMATLRADLDGVSRRIFPLWQSGFKDSTARYAPVPLRTAIIGNAPKTLWMFAAAAALLLLTAVANVANLMLARMTSRARELSLRAVLGASGSRLVRLVVAETVLVSAIGSLIGIVIAWGLLDVLIAIASIPRLATASINGTALAFAITVGVLTGLVIGIYPVLMLMRREAAPSLQGGSREVGHGHANSRLRGALVAVEFALALPLLAGAGQLIDSIARLQRVDPGFDPTHIGYLSLALPAARYDTAPRIMDYWRRAIANAKSIPGVSAVGYSTELPPDQVSNTNDFVIPGSTILQAASERVSPWLIVTPEYFDAMGARLLEGRMFSPFDTGAVNVLIVSESWAKHYSPDRPVVGREVYGGGCRPETCGRTYVIGVVTDIKYQGLDQSGDAAYGPSSQGMARGGYLLIRSSGEPGSVLPSVRRALRAMDPGVPIDVMEPMATHLYQATAAPRHWAMLLAGFALAALALAAIGTFGLLSYVVQTMRREIGVRVALGAQRREIARMVVGRGLAHSTIGALIGLALAIAGRRLIEASLFQVTPGDPMTLLGVTVTLLLVAVLASWIPARRASRTDPMLAMRSD